MARVPDRSLDGLELARATWTEFDHMWFFSNRSDDPNQGMRFDLQRPAGTCYLATDPVAALIEKLSDPEDADPLVAVSTLDQIMVWSGELPFELSVADVIDRRARLTLELGTLTPYDQGPWAWADALRDDGRGGIMWRLRFDPAEGLGIAVFGPASAPDDLPAPTVWPDLEDCVPATYWREELADAFDILEDPPSLIDLEVADD